MEKNVPSQSDPEWKNWSENLVHKPATSGEFYYFCPANREELKKFVLEAQAAGVQIRVSGQRHSQPPLVIEDNRGKPSDKSKTWLVDLSCYADLGTDGNEQITVDMDKKTVTVNAGVREDYLDAYLATKNLILKTVTAGGFFSVGGMTAVDVHGATFDAPIFAETVVAFSVMGPDGEVTVIDETTPGIGDWKAIQFARVSLGALGIVTSVTISVLERKWATTLSSGIDQVTLSDKRAFVSKYLQLFKDHQRAESFYNPYNNEFLILWWNLEESPPSLVPNSSKISVPTSCEFAAQGTHGAPYEPELVEWLAQGTIGWIQLHKFKILAKWAIDAAYLEIRSMFSKAQKLYTDLWLTAAARTTFLSYFIELPHLDEDGLGKVWQALQKVPQLLKQSNNFLVAGPLEFRFIKGGNSALSGAYTANKDSYFANLDLIGFVPKVPVERYPKQMLDFFAAVERSWYGEYKGMPHNGKMYGFCDPTASGDNSTPPFNKEFIADLAKRRGDRLAQFEAYRKTRDPKGRFCNDYLRAGSIGTT